MVKLCKGKNGCNIYLPLSSFGRNIKARDGLQSICRGCDSKRKVKYDKTPKGKLARKRYLKLPTS